MIVLTSLIVFTVLTTAWAHPARSPVPSKRVVHERRSSPTGWTIRRRADPETVLPLTIALTQTNIDKLDTYLLGVSDPASPDYGKHWTREAIAQTFRPSQHTADVVQSWLTSEGLDASRVRRSVNGGYMRVNVSVAEAEALLGTEYYVFGRDDGVERVACREQYQLPEEVGEHVDLVWPTLFLGSVPKYGAHMKRDVVVGHSLQSYPIAKPAPLGEGADPLAACDTLITLPCLRALYNFNYTLVAPDKHSIGVVEFGWNKLYEGDLDVFFSQYADSMIGKRPTFVSIDGGVLSDNPGRDDLIEANLDFQYAMGLLGSEADVLLYQVSSDGGSYEQFLAALDGGFCLEGQENIMQCGGAPLANVVSISYGGVEIEYGYDLAQRLCTEYGKLSLNGTTFVQSSGDYGVAGSGNDYCLDDNFNEAIFGGMNFNPGIGTDCPYVTVVGATQIHPGNALTDPEEAVSVIFASGGGFSNYFERPAFQDSVVQAYVDGFTTGLSPSAFTRWGRAYPDVSANGRDFSSVVNGNNWAASGTSASTPVVAAMLTSVNDARIAAGKSVIGWANPVMYSGAFSQVYHDVTVGNNNACGAHRELGFQAAPWWDPVTGLGTLDFGKMVKVWVALP